MTKISQYWLGLHIAHILDAYLAKIKGLISVYIPIHHVLESFKSENKSFIEFNPLSYQTGVFQGCGCFEQSKMTKIKGGVS